MIRFRHLSGSLRGRTSASSKACVRVGRAADCDIRFDAAGDPKVSNHHAEFLFEDGQWFVIDTASTNGTLIAGRKVQKEPLRQGEEVQLGVGGPVVRVEFDAAERRGGAMKTEAVSLGELDRSLEPKPQALRIDETQQVHAIASQLKESADTATAKLAEMAARKVAEERRKMGGMSSGQTLSIMANAMKQANASARVSTRKRWVRVVAAVAAVSAVICAAMGIVIARQRQQIERLVKQKDGIDKEIARVQAEMEDESDPVKLIELEERLNQLSGNAENTIAALRKTDTGKAQEIVSKGDELDQHIREILTHFDAATYAVPPIFKERLKYQIDVLKSAPNLKFVYRRKQKYWPMIQKEFSALGLPEEMAYIAWAETQFDPRARSAVGAAGMWQFTPSTAQLFNLRVDREVDERFDPAKETRAAARYLANLLAEYGSDSFMLAMASYNRGEAGVRRVLHQIAQDPGGFRKEKRDFWHLYRLKKLPEETREYVPRVLAAAIISRDARQLGLEDTSATDD